MARSTAGRTADILLLDANPLADIANTRRIRMVVTRGRALDRAGARRAPRRGARRGPLKPTPIRPMIAAEKGGDHMNAAIIAPVVALVAWTLVMQIWLYAARFPAMRRAGICR